MKPMSYTLAGYRAEVHGKPAITFNKDGHRYFIFEHEYEAWVKEHKKRLTDAECAAEYWRLKADLCGFGVVTDSPVEIDRKATTMRRFAEHPHAFQGAKP